MRIRIGQAFAFDPTLKQAFILPAKVGEDSYIGGDDTTLRQEIVKPVRPRLTAAMVLGSLSPFPDRLARQLPEITPVPNSDDLSDTIQSIAKITYFANLFLRDYVEGSERSDLLELLTRNQGALGRDARDFMTRLNEMKKIAYQYESLQETYFDCGKQQETLQEMIAVCRMLSAKDHEVRNHQFLSYIENLLKQPTNI